MEQISVQLSILLLLLLAFALAALFLTCLSLLTPWPRRKKPYFHALRHQYRPDEDLPSSTFPSLIDQEEEESEHSRSYHHTKPELYLTVIVPAMNEQFRLPQMLEECLEYLEKRAEESTEFTYEVIVVDDGSSDSTADVAFNYSQKYPLSVLQLAKNLGKGGAVREGVLCARGRFLVFADADGATRFADLAKLEREMHSLCNGQEAERSEPPDWTHPAMAVGSRAHLENESIASRSPFRTMLMVGFHALVWLFAVRTIRDTQCGFKMFSRSAAAKLFTQLHVERWAFDVELIYLAERQHFSLAEVAVQWTEVDGSKVVPVLSWLQMGRDIVLIWFRYRFGIWRVGDNV